MARWLFVGAVIFAAFIGFSGVVLPGGAIAISAQTIFALLLLGGGALLLFRSAANAPPMVKPEMRDQRVSQKPPMKTKQGPKR